MLKRILLAWLGCGLLLAGAARAETDSSDYSVVLLTENFPPYNMAINGKNFAQEDSIDGIAVDIVKPWAFQSAAWAIASEITHFVNGVIKSFCSARGMNLFGEIEPRVGCRQRASASTPTMVSVRRSSFAWYCSDRPFLSMASCRSSPVGSDR